MSFTSLIQDKFIDIVKKKTGIDNPMTKKAPNWCYIQAHQKASEKVHFELQQGDRVYVCFHNEAHGNSYEWRYFWNKATNGNYPILNWDGNGCIRREIESLDKLQSVTEALIQDVMPLLEESYGKNTPVQDSEASSPLPDFEVGIVSRTALDLLKTKLFIPSYQREYCWRPEDVNSLFNDIDVFFKHSKSSGEYHLGTIVLKAENDGRYAVIDGQQRLTTLAIWQYLASEQRQDPIPNILSEDLKDEEGKPRVLSQAACNALLRAKQTIEEWKNASHAEIDLSNVVFSVVVLGKNQPDDLAYTFFSSSNSTGRRLSDFDLLKSHHLRFIHDAETAKEAVECWNKFERDDLQEELLHHSLFRLRNWRCGIEFNFEATSTPDCREVYRHYSYTIKENREFPMMQMQQFRFDSILPGGQAFFQYSEHYRRLYMTFRDFAIIKKLDASLGWHSNGVLRDGIKAIAFLFYCKFGAGYLQEAVYALAYRLSELRNAARVMRQYINQPVFREATSLLDRVTTVRLFLASLLTPEQIYSIDNKGRTAKIYWDSLHTFLAEIENDSGMLVNNGMKYSDLFLVK